MLLFVNLSSAIHTDPKTCCIPWNMILKIDKVEILFLQFSSLKGTPTKLLQAYFKIYIAKDAELDWKLMY
ncbi:hypothetical protein HYE05_02430 [Mycoplasmopsis bovis]|nr:hypothetical protein [Mycoplasmopsis bovis]QQH27588.1 hypothetical protein HYE05_02430 [Mycoplasmopsis bovis]